MENLHFGDQSKQSTFFLFFVAVFSKRNKNLFSVLLLSSKNTCESFQELKKAVGTLNQNGICDRTLEDLY